MAIIPVVTDPATPADAPAAPAAEAPKTFEAVRAARHDAATAPPEPVANPPGPAKAQIDMSPEELTKATAASKAEREARQAAKELEAKAPLAAKLESAQTLIAEGKHAAAAEMLGIDLNAAVAEQLGVAPAPGEEIDPKIAELAKTVDALKASDAERAKRDAEETQKRVAAARESDVGQVVEHVKEHAAQYPYLARNPEWVAEAYDGANDAYPTVKAELGRELNAEEKTRLVEAALAEAEAKHAEKAKLYGAAPEALERKNGAIPPRPSARPVTLDSSLRGGTAQPAQRPKTKLTFAEVKARRRTS